MVIHQRLGIHGLSYNTDSLVSSGSDQELDEDEEEGNRKIYYTMKRLAIVYRVW